MAENILGVDIGSSSVKAVLIRKSFPAKKTVVKAHMVSVSPGMQKEAVEKCLQEFPGAHKIVASLDRINVSSKIIALPTNEHSKIRKLTPFQLEGKVPFLQNALTDGTFLYSKENNEHYCLLSALNLDDLLQRKELLSRCKVSEIDYTVDSLALINLFLKDTKTPSNAILVDCGCSKTVVSIISGRKLIASRIIRDGMKKDEETQKNDFAIKLSREIKRTILSSKP